MILGILIALSPLWISNFNLNFGDPNFNSPDDSKVSLNTSKASGKIQIIGNSGWVIAKVAGICTGSGTSNDPYVIEDLEINGGDSGSCILIANSDVHFRIENCTISNAGVGWGDGGIKLYDVYNGHIIDNTANVNGFVGIILEYCHNNNISGNSANNNIEYGIGLWYSDHNVISGNTFNFNGLGLFFETCNNNSITLNNGERNSKDGMGILGSTNNIIAENNLNDNRNGLSLLVSDGNIISKNSIKRNYIGIDIIGSKCNSILNNTFSYNNFDISGTQDACDTPPPRDPPPRDPPPFNPPNEGPSPFNPFLIAYTLVIGLPVASAIILTVVLKRRKRYPAQKAILVEKSKEESKIKEIPVIENGLEPKVKPQLIIPPDLKKLDVIHEDVKPSISEIKPEELELFEGEIEIVQEEIIEKEQVIEEIIVPTETIVEEEQLLEETIVPTEKIVDEERLIEEIVVHPEEILEEEEKIVKDTIEVPKIEIFNCKFCGMELSSDVFYCLRCGHKLKK